MRTKPERQGQGTPGLRRGALLLLALVLAAGCPGEPVPAPETFDLRPRWEEGRVLEVREERVHHRGTGRFPAAGELSTRAGETEREVDVFRLTVLSVAGDRPARTRRTYSSSRIERSGKVEPSPMNGRTYEIEEPLGECRVFLVEGEKVSGPAPEEEARRVRLSAVRMAASLLPARPVRVSELWQPGRDRAAFSRLGRATVGMEARLASVEDGPEGRAAEVTGETWARIAVPRQPDLLVSQKEELRVDLGTGLPVSYRIVIERHRGPNQGPAATWHRTETTATLTPLGK